jgi:putative transposase
MLGASRWSRSRRGVQANCFAERFVLTIRTEVTDRMPIFGEWPLRQVLAEYAAYCNGRRPHRAEVSSAAPDVSVREPIRGRIRRRPILGGLISASVCGFVLVD